MYENAHPLQIYEITFNLAIVISGSFVEEVREGKVFEKILLGKNHKFSNVAHL